MENALYSFSYVVSTSKICKHSSCPLITVLDVVALILGTLNHHCDVNCSSPFESCIKQDFLRPGSFFVTLFLPLSIKPHCHHFLWPVGSLASKQKQLMLFRYLYLTANTFGSPSETKRDAII